MTDAEITAYMAGSHTAELTWRSEHGDIDADAALNHQLTEVELRSLTRLGAERFAYWMMRGAIETAEVHR